jgi:hypothetical protein
MAQVPSVSVKYAANGNSTKPNELGMRAMQVKAYEKRGGQYLLIKSPPASGKSCALMFIALGRLHNQGLRQARFVVPEKSIRSSFNDQPLSKHGFWADWEVTPQWNLCNAPGGDNGKVGAVDKVLRATTRCWSVAIYELYNINRTRLEHLIHRIFEPARRDIEIMDRFGRPVAPKEWFLVPLFAIKDAVEKIKDATFAGFVYDPTQAKFVQQSGGV